MKIRFIEGKERSEEMVIEGKRPNSWCLGYYQGSYYIRLLSQRVKKTKSRIVVVKQKSRLQTLCTLGHEIAHWFADVFLWKGAQDKFDAWLDRK